MVLQSSGFLLQCSLIDPWDSPSSLSGSISGSLLHRFECGADCATMVLWLAGTISGPVANHETGTTLIGSILERIQTHEPVAPVIVYYRDPLFVRSIRRVDERELVATDCTRYPDARDQINRLLEMVGLPNPNPNPKANTSPHSNPNPNPNQP